MKLIIKVFLLSLVISLLIKDILPNFSIPATTTTALIIVLLPTIVLAFILLWRMQRHEEITN
ncbi:MAG: hypothetical protein QNJ49_18700 [Mastigocoleus sp. MO_167.B18]|nr:hypothetical protein [Mastigocoleus sp. MO_167.B18]